MVSDRRTVLMICEWLLVLLYGSLLCASGMPIGLMLGASCSPCCGSQCGGDKSSTHPKDEGTWVPSGSWPNVTWTFQSNPGDESGNTWFFFGSASTSKSGGNATVAEQRDWGNLCNWYSNKTITPSDATALSFYLNKRASTLPGAGAVVHIYSTVSTQAVGPVTVKHALFWQGSGDTAFLETGSTLTATDGLLGNTGVVFNGIMQNFGTCNGGVMFNGSSINFATVNGGSSFNNSASNGNGGTVNGGATFNSSSLNRSGGTVKGGATFNNSSQNQSGGTVNNGATFNNSSINSGTVNGGATFNAQASNQNGGTVNEGATFNNTSLNGSGGTVNGGATFNNSSTNFRSTTHGGATFNDTSSNAGDTTIINGGATFNNSSANFPDGSINGGATFNGSAINYAFNVNGGATFNGNACSMPTTGNFFATPCSRKFVAHPTDLPTCNGSAKKGCDSLSVSCGCG